MEQIPSLDRIFMLIMELYKTTSMEKISFCTESELHSLQEFIHEKWKENHILSFDKELLDFQHKSKDGYNVVISKNKQNQITAILGFIPLSQFDKSLNNNNDLWLAIWKADTTAASPGVGFTLLKWLEKLFQPSSIGSIGINTEVKKIYDILGYKTGILNHYYILNPNITDCKIAKCEKVEKKLLKSKVVVSSVVKEITIEQVDNLSFKTNPLKSLNYIKNRYIEHPYYKYLLLGVYTNDVLKAIIVARKIKVNQSSCLRIVDIQGDYSEIGYIEDELVSVLEKYESEYIDCYNYGISKELFCDWGFELRDSDSDLIIPNYFEPFLRENVDILFAYKSTKPDYVIFKGDSDQDRPNVLQ